MSSQKFNRRRFIERSSLGMVGAGLAAGKPVLPGTGLKMEEEPKIMEYRTLGRTGFKVSDIASGSPSNEAVLKLLLDSGVNYIDTGEQYGNGNNEKLIAKVLKDYDRKKVFIMDKIYTETDFGSREEVLNRMRQALERLETDYIDCMGIHSAENSRIVTDEAFHAAAEQLKQEGRVKYIGLSCHGNNHLLNPEENLEKVLMTAIEDGRFDHIQMAYNFMNAEISGKVMKACGEKGIGTSIIKSNPVQLYIVLSERIKQAEEAGNEPNEYTVQFYDKFKAMTEEGREYFRGFGAVTDEEMMLAATKFVLSNPDVGTILYQFANFNDVKTFVGLSGQKLTPREAAMLDNYKEAFGHLNCRIGCNQCESACPHHLPVGTIMRYNYYFSVKKQEREAMEKYAKLPGGRPHEVCNDCSGHCESACPYGVATRSILAMAHNNLHWMA